jgi:zinc transporter 7
MKFQFGALALLPLALGTLGHVPKLADLTEKSLEKSQPLYYSNGDLNLESMNQQLSKCTIVKDISEKLTLKHEGDSESMVTYLFSKLFPFENPAYNALLATTYISGPPNLILGFIPASIDPSKLSMLIGFAIGGLLGDVFLHLLPQTFVGEPVDHSTASFVLVDEKRNSILGLFIFIGFMSFFLIDKSLRILEHQQGHEWSHSHSHAPSDADVRRHKKTDGDQPVIANPNASVKTSAYLNLISDFSHNITDGLAIAASFYISKSVGSTTCLAVFFHEIPHEVGDFALLIQGGFTKWQAMNSQFLTALGAYLGTFLGIFIQTYGMSPGEVVVGNDSPGLFGTSVTTGDLTLPFTAGGFLYIATVGVIPEILELEKNNTRTTELLKGLGQLFFILIGISLMFLISWME